MKKLLLSFSAILLMAFAANAQKEMNGGPKIKFDKEIHDYGTIEQGGNGTSKFQVTNTGDKPLIIKNCKGSCGCTVPQCPKEPIKPGESKSIKVKYDTKRIGPINKSVRVSSNAENSPNKTIRIKGKVIKPKTSPKKEESEGAPVEK